MLLPLQHPDCRAREGPQNKRGRRRQGAPVLPATMGRTERPANGLRTQRYRVVSPVATLRLLQRHDRLDDLGVPSCEPPTVGNAAIVASCEVRGRRAKRVD